MLIERETIEELALWYRKNKRQMAWRDDPSPYHVLVSEVMLQQTRIETVKPYYDAFLRRFPDVSSLAAASEEELLKHWEGLGYYSRARNLKKACETIETKYGGVFPDTYDSVIALPGVGPYTAGAILSMAFHLPYPVVDGNVLRVVTRLMGSRDDIRDPKTGKSIEKALSELLGETGLDASEMNQALMELGETICIPNGKPLCDSCPVRQYCTAFREKLTGEIPFASPKPEKRKEEKTVFLIRLGGRILLEKRTGRTLLSGLYGYPMKDGFLSESERRAVFRGIKLVSETDRKEVSHVFTHIVWRMKAYEVTVSGDERAIVTILGERFGAPVSFVTESEIGERYALPSAFKKW